MPRLSATPFYKDADGCWRLKDGVAKSVVALCESSSRVATFGSPATPPTVGEVALEAVEYVLALAPSLVPAEVTTAGFSAFLAEANVNAVTAVERLRAVAGTGILPSEDPTKPSAAGGEQATKAMALNVLSTFVDLLVSGDDKKMGVAAWDYVQSVFAARVDAALRFREALAQVRARIPLAALKAAALSEDDGAIRAVCADAGVSEAAWVAAKGSLVRALAVTMVESQSGLVWLAAIAAALTAVAEAAKEKDMDCVVMGDATGSGSGSQTTGGKPAPALVSNLLALRARYPADAIISGANPADFVDILPVVRGKPAAAPPAAPVWASVGAAQIVAWPASAMRYLSSVVSRYSANLAALTAGSPARFAMTSPAGVIVVDLSRLILPNNDLASVAGPAAAAPV